MPNYQKNQLLRHDDRIIRVLTVDTDVLTIDCLKRTMPQWMPAEDLQDWEPCDETALPSPDAPICDMEELTPEQRKVMHERYTLIAPVLPFIHKEAQRSAMITQMAELNGVSKQTIRKYLCLYLTYQRMEVLAPPAQQTERELTTDEKNFRWALNKFYYTQRKHSLPTAYNLMLQHKYTDAAGQLVPGYPPFHRFKYFYQRHRKEQTALISREGKTNYQRNSRPLLGTIQDFAPSVGTAMLDSTICDVYLVNESNQLVGRPVLTLAVDAYSSLICGYHLSWEGGVYSLQQLMHNVVTEKVAWCQSFGISITPEEWPVNSLPGVLVTDKGKEYVGNTFEQLTETGVRMVNLPPYRPELKGIVEHTFSLLHSYFLPHLKGKGTIEPDFQERGARDYRKDACLTILRNRETEHRRLVEDTYDEDGRCLQGITSHNGIEQSRSEYEYDASGNLTTNITYSSNGEIWRTEYSYDDRGNKVLMICYKGNAETSRDEYIYNFANQLTKRIRYNGAETTTYICEYDRKGCLIKSRAYGEINGQAYTTAEITYRYIKKRMSLEKAQKLKAEAVHSNFYVYIDN